MSRLSRRTRLVGLALLAVLLVSAWLAGAGRTVRAWLWSPMTELQARLFLVDEFPITLGCTRSLEDRYGGAEWYRRHGSSADAEMVAIRERLRLPAFSPGWTSDQAWRALTLWSQLRSIKLEGTQGRYKFELFEDAPQPPFFLEDIRWLLQRDVDPILPGSSSHVTVPAWQPIRIEGQLEYGRVTVLKREPGQVICPR